MVDFAFGLYIRHGDGRLVPISPGAFVDAWSKINRPLKTSPEELAMVAAAVKEASQRLQVNKVLATVAEDPSNKHG